MLQPIEAEVRQGEMLDADADLVVRGSPLNVEGLLRNADATRGRYSWRGEPFVAVSADVTAGGWTLDAILAGRRMRTRSRYARAMVSSLVIDGFELLPTLGAPHYSVRLPSYDERSAQWLLDLPGTTNRNPFYVGRQR